MCTKGGGGIACVKEWGHGLFTKGGGAWPVY